MYHFYVAAAVMVGLLIRIRLHFVDKTRIRHAAIDQNWSDVSIKWAPFAPGWFFEGQERHYLVTYRDEAGRPRERYCKVRLLGYVYWKDP